MLPLWVELVPIATAAACYWGGQGRWPAGAHLAGSTITSLLALWLAWNVAEHGEVRGLGNFFDVDALGAIVLMLIGLIGWVAAFHSVGYLRRDLEEGRLDPHSVRHYYAAYHLFAATMLAVCLINNMGLLWVGIEATTIVSAWLVALYRKGEALEAAWKYLMLCGAGIAIALLGIILLYASAEHAFGSRPDLLDWTFLRQSAPRLQPSVIRLSFVFLFIGIGTKIGLAPLHFWLPDAHSQAPTPVSAVLSGVLLNCALLVLIRFAFLTELAAGKGVVQPLFIGFGLLSVFIAFPFILVQQDIKRMLAYSTVEHMGILAVAIGIGGAAGYSAALLQLVSHAMAKSLLFLSSGNLLQKYGSKLMPRIQGALRVMPFTGLMLVAGMLAITGTPPFSLFASEFAVLSAGFAQGRFAASALLIAGIALIFCAMIYHGGRMAFGVPREKIPVGELNRWSTWPLLLPLAFILLLGFYVPRPLAELIRQAVIILTGGGA